MKSAISAVALCVILGGSTTAFADGHKKDTKMGIGVGSTFFVTGIDGRFALTDDIGLEAVFGFTVVSADDGMGGSSTDTSIAFGARGLYGLFNFTDHTRVFGFGGLSIFNANDNTLVGLEAGLKVEWFPVSFASLSVGLGVGIGINDDAGIDMMGNAIQATTITIGAGDLMGDAAWTFWW